jgi:hypothetical protein
MFTSLFHSNGFRPSAVCRVQRQKPAFFLVARKNSIALEAI